MAPENDNDGPQNIWRTTYQIEVLSEGPFTPDGGDNDPFDLLSIHYAIYEGPCIGDVRFVDAQPVPPARVSAALIAVGNDGEFFDRQEG